MFRPALLLLLAATAVSAQETMIRETFDPKTDTHVEITALFSKAAPGGYFPVRVKIANNLANERSIRLNFACTSGYYSAGITSSSTYNFSAPAGKSVTRDIYVPTSPAADGGMNSLSVNLSGSLGTATNSISAGFGGGQPAVLLSEVLFTPNASMLDSAVSGRFTSGYRSSNEFAARFDPKQTPDDWRAYVGYDSILMTDFDWANTPPGARNAILSWVRLGGQLAIHTATGATLETLGLPAESSFGEIVITPISATNSLDAKKTLDLVIKRRTLPRQQSIQSDFDGSWPLQFRFGSRAFQYGLFILVLITFGILVGPVNLFVFAKSGRRHKLFITTPIISLATSLLLIGMIILQDGLGGNGRRMVLMEVRPDGGQNAAYLHQEQFCRTGVLTGTRFTIDSPCAITPVPIAGSRWARFTNGYTTTGNFNLQPDGTNLDASGDWFQSRSEHGHFISAVIPTRGRIETTNDPRILVSTFEFPIQTFYHLDAAGQWHRAENIQPGKRFSLTPVDASMVGPELQKTAQTFTQRLRNQLSHLAKRPGHYVAITTAAPGIDTLPGIDWESTDTVITGPVL